MRKTTHAARCRPNISATMQTAVSGRSLPCVAHTRCLPNRSLRLSISARAGLPSLGMFGTKAGMTQIFTPEGLAIPATVIAIDDGNIVTHVSLRSPVLGARVSGSNSTRSSNCMVDCSQVKTEATDGYTAVQVGYQVCKERKVTKPELNHLKKAGAPAMRRLTEFKVSCTGDIFLQQMNEVLLQGAEHYPPVGNRSATQKNTAQGSSLEWRNCSILVTSWTSRERALAKAFKVGCDLHSQERDQKS